MQIKIPHFGYVLTDQLNHAFYRHAEDGRTIGLLDDALGNQNLPLLEELLESYFVTLRNVPEVSSVAEQR